MPDKRFPGLGLLKVPQPDANLPEFVDEVSTRYKRLALTARGPRAG